VYRHFIFVGKLHHPLCIQYPITKEGEDEEEERKEEEEEESEEEASTDKDGEDEEAEEVREEDEENKDVEEEEEGKTVAGGAEVGILPVDPLSGAGIIISIPIVGSLNCS
jgi:hypothetical protein